MESGLRKELLLVMKILLNEGIFEHTAGHVSARLRSAPGRILISGHIHTRKRSIDSLSEDDFAVMDIEGRKIEGDLDPPGERFIHTGVYQRRPEVCAVVHAHPSISVSITIAGQDILPVFHRGTIFAPKVPTFDYPGQIDTPALGKALAETLGSGYCAMIRGHGSVCVGENLRQACVATLMLENNALHQMRALQMGGTVRVIEPQYIHDGIINGLDKEEYFSNPWVYYVNRVGERQRE